MYCSRQGECQDVRPTEADVMIDALDEQVSEVLWSVWDPIGVNSNDTSRSEYDSFVGGVVAMLQRDPTPQRIDAHLAELERSALGLPRRSFGSRRTAVQRLVALVK